MIDQKQPQPKAVTSSKPSISACATVVGNGDMFLQTATNGHGPPVLARFASETLEARLTTTPILGTRLCRGTRFQPDSQAAAKGTPLPGETIEKAAVRREHQGKKKDKKRRPGWHDPMPSKVAQPHTTEIESRCRRFEPFRRHPSPRRHSRVRNTGSVRRLQAVNPAVNHLTPIGCSMVKACVQHMTGRVVRVCPRELSRVESP